MKPSNYDAAWARSLAGAIAVIGAASSAMGAWKDPCRVATTASVTIATALNAGDTIDGVTLAEGDRVLVWAQSSSSQNGIYQVGTTPGRAADFDSGAEVLGAFVPILAGTVYGGQVFRNTNTTAPVVDTDDITFETWPPQDLAAQTAMVPYEIASGDSFTVSLYKQALFTMTINVASGATLVVDGYLLEVS